MSANQQSIAEPTERNRATRQIYIGEEPYEICRSLAYERRSTIRDEADRLILLGVKADTTPKKGKR